MTRKEYLESWKPYPLCPPNCLARGRITAISDGRILVQGRWFAVPAELVSVFVCGDIVAVCADGITLLAPHLSTEFDLTRDPEQGGRFAAFLGEIRKFFVRRGFMEIATPTLVDCPGTEPSLEPFATEFVVGNRRKKFFLPTSPELHLKKTLVLGAEKVFEIKTCYRNGEVTEVHQPEFTMLEWYRAYERPESLKEDLRELLAELAGEQNWTETTVSELFRKHLDFCLTPQTQAQELRQLAVNLGLNVQGLELVDDFFTLLWVEKIEPYLPNGPLLVSKYPPFQAALARLDQDGWGDRFEFYWRGLEIANAFHELNDPRLQEDRFQEDLGKRDRWGKTPIALDQEFLAGLRCGMPPASGIALGLERLYMALHGLSDIRQTRVFAMRT
ncbi:MAG: EF-P lysine aminoacylase GenX [Bdellovibrionaceae bacterium]|nr:EF-P lysine aminoacylase GenX [Pseudobdellovibrionaceae bacterium]